MRQLPRDRSAAAPFQRLSVVCVFLLATAVLLSAAAGPARALTPIPVEPDQDRIEITALGEIYAGRGDTLQVETAPGPDGITGRMSVRATTPGISPSWVVFALRNPSEKPIERWLTAERYTVVGSGIIWPDLDARRIEAVTPSLGYLPERVKSDRADIFRISLEPGQTITYVAELSSDRFARIYLWKPLEYELKARDRQLFNGIMLGISGLLAMFLTAVFAANHKAIFPAAALVSWCVLGYLCVDFGFWHKLFQLRPEDNAVYRAATESAIAASLVIFLGVFLRLGSWNPFVRMLASVWVAAQLSLIAIAVIDPRLAATFARASFVGIGGVGAILILYLALRGQDRALSLIPSWLLMLVWIFAAGVTLTGKMSGDVVVSGLVAGLVLIIVLLGFTVTQFAFRSYEPFYGTAPSDLQLRSLAIDGAGAAVWEWLARRDEIKVSPIVEASLGMTPGELSTKVDDFAKHLHPSDKERFRVLLWSVQERNGGNLHIELRMRHADNTYRWFELDGASVPHADRKALRCVGLMRDITEAKRAQERLVHDAVHDNLTGLPNRELFLDRLGVAVQRAKSEPHVRPAVMFIDIDKFKSVNSSLGLIVGDSLLLNVARRLTRHLGPQDTLARVGGDQFALLLMAVRDSRELSMLAERIRRSLRSAMKIAGKEIVLTASTGIAIYDGHEVSAHDLLKEAEIAMYRAKRGGADRIEIFQPELRSQPDERIAIESDLRRAIERKQILILYQPIIYLPTEELAGFEALVRWEHPKHGLLNPAEFIPVAEESDLIVKLGSYVLTRAAQEAARWHKELPRGDNQIFVSVNVSSRQIFRQDLLQEIRHILGRATLPPGALRLEITESLVMENPEQAVEMLEWLRSAGAGLSLDDFGAGYSSLAYLQRFPFDTIKIDRGIVQSSSGDGPGSAIVRSIVALAHELGKKVVGEGVEEPEDAHFLRSLGCEFAQGYYYGEPMSEKDVVQLLREIRKSERKLQRRGFFRAKLARKKKNSQQPEAGAVPLNNAGPAAPAPAPAERPAPAAGGIPREMANGGASPMKDGGAEKAEKEGDASDKRATRMRWLISRGVRSRARTSEAGEPAPAAPALKSQQTTAPPPLPPPSKTLRPAQASGRRAGAPERTNLGTGSVPARRPDSSAASAPSNGTAQTATKSVPVVVHPAAVTSPPPLAAVSAVLTATPPAAPIGPARARGAAAVNQPPPPVPADRPAVRTVPPPQLSASAGPALPMVEAPPVRPADATPSPGLPEPPGPPSEASQSTNKTPPATPAAQPRSGPGGTVYPSLPPAIAQSLAKLAGVPLAELPAVIRPAGEKPGNPQAPVLPGSKPLDR